MVVFGCGNGVGCGGGGVRWSWRFGRWQLEFSWKRKGMKEILGILRVEDRRTVLGN